MKRFKRLVFIVLLILISSYNVNAKDISYSMNKYDDENFVYIEKAYDKDLKADGYLLGGNILKEKIEKDGNTYDDYQVMVVKYNKNDNILWKYIYGNNKDDYIDCLSYTYDDNGNIDGYLIVTKKTYNIFEEESSNNSVIIKLDLDGKVVFERNINEGIIKKIIPTTFENNIDGYIGIVNSSLVKYNKNFDIVWKRDFSGVLKDLTLVQEEKDIIGYSIILDNSLIRLDNSGNNDLLLEDLSRYISYHLEKTNNGFILYGLTDEVEVKDGDYSYYLINYINNSEKEEILGDTSIDKEYDINLVMKKGKCFLLYKNSSDKSYEVIKVDKDGLSQNKIKKIKNSYYALDNFYVDGKTIYFIGKIKCQEDEKCDYNSRSLYLISSEDKVIEIKDNPSNNIIIVFSVIFVIIVGGIIIIRKKTSK